MTMKPMIAFHKTSRGDVLSARDFNDNYSLRSWLGGLDVEPGDSIEFREAAVRLDPDFDEVEQPQPTFIEPTAPLETALAGDDQPF
jgi:hypothetical protein